MRTCDPQTYRVNKEFVELVDEKVLQYVRLVAAARKNTPATNYWAILDSYNSQLMSALAMLKTVSLETFSVVAPKAVQEAYDAVLEIENIIASKKK
jgi:hypothetical protein